MITEQSDAAWHATNGGDTLHVVPIDDLREHPLTSSCWCHPTEDEVTANLWIHHSMDRREDYESGALLPC